MPEPTTSAPPPAWRTSSASQRESQRRRDDGHDDRDPSASDVALFQAALHGQRGDGEGAGGEDAPGGNGQNSRRHPSTEAPDADPVANGIFGLFGAVPAPAPPPAATPEPGAAPRTPAQFIAALADAVQVGADGTRVVRVQLSADVLPGVQFQLSQDAGRLIVDFDVSHASSAELLEGAGEQMAATLARRLGRGIEIRVQPARRVDGSSPALPRRFFHDTPTEPEQGTPA